MRKLAIFFLILLALWCCTTHVEKQTTPYVVMLSLDGFRWDYCDLYDTPNLDSIAKIGVKAKSMQASFPTKTFPNHYTIATGMYPGHHGIIGNTFYDYESETTYKIRDRSKVEDPHFYKGEPIWVTAEKQGITTASYYWIGSETPIKGIYPSYWKRYDSSVPFEDRIDSVIHWLESPYAKRPKLITYYSGQPDGVGHKYGPESPETGKMIHYLDSLVGVSLKKINQLKIKDSIHFIVVSDHGMGAISNDKVVRIQNLVKKGHIERLLGYNPVYYLYPNSGYTDSIYATLSKHEGITTYRKKDLPERFHLKQNPNVSELILAANKGWAITHKEDSICGGTHGYDNENKDMDAIFYAIGPQFKSGFEPETFSNIEVYNIICQILGLEPSPNDGNIENVQAIFKNK